MKIVFFETKDWEQVYLKQGLANFELEFFDKSHIQSSDAEILSNFVALPIGEEILKNFPKAKYITTRSTGFDHIDLKACEVKGIVVSNVPSYGENTVAEFTFALILSLSRKLYPSIKRVREQAHFSTENLQGFDLKGKIMGVVGTGHIGEHVIRIAQGFEMKVVAYDPHQNKRLAKQYGFSYVSLEELLRQSDIVSLHVPYLPETHHLINAEKFKLFKPGSLLINTSRGGLLETASLIQALKEGRLAGAALDVLEEEGYIKDELSLLSQHPNEEALRTILADHELMRMENVIVTPHNAFNTKEAVARILDTTVANIRAFAEGRPINLVKQSWKAI